jgi:ferredoxin
LNNGECRRVKMCDDCAKLWNVRNLKRNGGGVHICGEKYCKTCHVFHNPDQGCFMPASSEENEEKDEHSGSVIQVNVREAM